MLKHLLVVAALLTLLLVLRSSNRRARKRKNREARWSIGILRGQELAQLHGLDDPHNPVLTAADVTDLEADFVADCFLLQKQGLWHMFFEVFGKKRALGEIGCATSQDGSKWNYQGIVLKEDFHLSYPYVFEHQGNYYMIPETRKTRSVRLYKAESFPYGWRLDKILLEGNYADSSIIFYEGLWWIFSVHSSYNLAIFYADNLHGPWKPHKKNLIYIRRKKRARPGGRLVVADGKLIRFAQDSVLGYGHQLRAFEVQELTPQRFKERQIQDDPILSPGGVGWRSFAMHHMDPQQLPDGSWIAAVDGSGIPRAR